MDSEHNEALQWRPTCELNALKVRAELYARIRTFFAERQVLEVETPLLGASTATDPYLASVPVLLHAAAGQTARQFFLHTSPEFPMKRLLAAGSGAIFQICKTFRDAESGRRHNPEFSMLEWYRPDFTLEQLMNEVAELVSRLLYPHQPRVHYISYRQAFRQYLGIDPFSITDNQLRDLAQAKTGFSVSREEAVLTSRDDYLNLLISHCIEPELGRNLSGEPTLCFLHAYPESQASLAKVTRDDLGQRVAERFELYINGLEIANGYFELTDAREQRQRFEQDNKQREQLKLPQIPVDTRFLAALESGLPECSGVALGLDRLLMIKQQADTIDDVISFPVDRA